MAKTSAGEIRLLCIGDARIETDRARITPTANVLFAIVLYLLLESAKPVARTTLAELLWPSASARVRTHRLRQALLVLRRSGVSVESVGKSLIRLGYPRITLEHEEFVVRVPDLKSLVPNLRPLFGFEPRLSTEYEDWLERKRGQMTSALVGVLIHSLTQHRYAGDWSAVESLANALLQISPLNEEATLALAEAYAMRGSKRDASRLLESYLEETGKEPSAIRVQASMMRRRIADQLAPRTHEIVSEAPLVGREATMTRLAELLKSIQSGSGKAFIVLGDAGIGKSRVLAEFSKFAALQGVLTMRINCRHSHQHRPLSAFLELVPLLRSLPGAIGCAPETLRCLDRITRYEPNRDEPPETGESAWIFGAIQRALFDLVDAVAHESMLLIQIEDIHWLDAASADVLREMVDRAPNDVLFGLTGRDVPEQWRHAPPASVCRVRLEPINCAEAANLISSIAYQSQKEMQQTHIDWCVRVAEGNPYFLTELAGHWADTGIEHDVPPSLSAILNHRISRLDRDSLQLLQTCAMLENNSTLPRIEAVLENDAFQLLASIDTLGSMGMIVVESGDATFGDRVVSRHELLSNAALTQLSPPARRFLHRRIGQVLEREIDEHFSAARLWDCAKHWLLAGDHERALRLGTSCASYLMKVGLPVDAADAYARSLAFCTTDTQRLELLKAQTVAFYRMSAWPRLIETAASVRNLQQTVAPDGSGHDEIELMELRAQWQTFEWYAVLEKTMKCLQSSTATIRHRAEAGVMAQMLAGMKCDREIGIAIHRMIEEMIASNDVSDEVALQTRMVFHIDFGEIETGVTAAIKLVERQRGRGDMGELFRATCNAAAACRVAGQFDEAERLFLEALEFATSHGLASAEQRAIPPFAHMSLEIGNIDKARELYERLIRIPISPADQFTFVQQQALGVRIALHDGNGQLARTLLPFSLEDVASEPMFGKRTYNLALLVAVELSTSGGASTHAVTCLEESFQRSRSGLHQAFSAFVLYCALKEGGQLKRARQILREYEQRYRREPWAAPRHLLQSLEQTVGRGLAC